MVQRWIKQYREKGLAGLANAKRSDKGTSRKLEDAVIQLIEDLSLQKPPHSMAAIFCQVTTIATAQLCACVALVTMAHQGAAAYREAFDLLYRREAPHSNAMWQADHCEFPILLLDGADKPYFTAMMGCLKIVRLL